MASRLAGCSCKHRSGALLSVLLLLHTCTCALIQLDYLPPRPANATARDRPLITDETRRREFQDYVAFYGRMQAKTMRQWNHDPALLCTAAKVHGRIMKTALGNVDPWHRLGWRYQPHFGNHSIPLYSGVMVYISAKFRFIFLRNAKSSSSSLLQAMTATFCGRGGVCRPEELALLEQAVPRPHEWESYVVFTWTRNPWLRMASSYTMMTRTFLRRRVEGQDAPGPHCGHYISFRAFAADPYALVRVCEERGCCAYNVMTHKWEDDFIGSHLNDQSHIAFLPSGASMVDFIGRTEFIEHDWNELLLLLEERLGQKFKRVRMERINPTFLESSKRDEGDPDYVPCLGRKAELLNATMMRALAKWYAADIQVLGF